MIPDSASMKLIDSTPAIVSLALALAACPADSTDEVGTDEANDTTTETETTESESSTDTESESSTDTETETTESETTESTTETETTETETTETGDPEFPDLVGYWSFNGDSEDHSGVNIDLTAVGDPEYQASVSAGLGTAYALDGNDGAIGSDFVKIVGDNATIVAWVYADDLSGAWNTIVKNWGDLDPGQFHLGLGQDVSDTLQSVIAGSPVAVETDFPVGQWVHVAVVIDAVGEHQLYVDGIHMATSEYVPPLDPGLATGLGIGVKPNGDGSMVSQNPEVGYWIGRIDEVGLYAAALTQAQITTLHMNGLNGVQLDGTSE